MPRRPWPLLLPAPHSAAAANRAPTGHNTQRHSDAAGRAMTFAMESVMSGYGQKMLLKLKVLMMKEQFCDVEVILHGRHILCHKVVLASASEYFENMFR